MIRRLASRIGDLASIERVFATISRERVSGLNNELARKSGGYVAKILKGAKPSELPVERPTKFEFVINLKTAKQLGVTMPQSILLRADRVIQ